nr:MAG TPA: hypothetical protein [Caudoviricetes sp.]
MRTTTVTRTTTTLAMLAGACARLLTPAPRLLLPLRVEDKGRLTSSA